MSRLKLFLKKLSSNICTIQLFQYINKVIRNMLMFHKFKLQRKYLLCATWITHKICI